MLKFLVVLLCFFSCLWCYCCADNDIASLVVLLLVTYACISDVVADSGGVAAVGVSVTIILLLVSADALQCRHGCQYILLSCQ
jgi:hypothetical protein